MPTHRSLTLRLDLLAGLLVLGLTTSLAGCATNLCTSDDPAERAACCADCAVPGHEDDDNCVTPLATFCATDSDAGTSDAGTDAAPAPRDAGPCGMTCAAPRPVCDETTGDCVECTDADTTACGPEESCINNDCAECANDADCDEPTAARCDAGTCVACDDDAQCAGIGDTGVCDVPAGTCVECTAAEAGGCTSGVCRPGGTCSDYGDAQTACQPCDTDLNCVPGQLCVTLQYPVGTGADYGSFCQWRRDAAPPGPNGACADNTDLASSPWAFGWSDARSVDGATADLCTLATTTCTALLQHRTQVTGCETPGDDDGACGEPGLPDGRCRNNSTGQPRCTYPCLGNEDCRAPSSSCIGGAGSDYCSI